MPRISLTQVDGIRLRNFILAGSKWLSYHKEHLDKINYFPVPDSDTGANMYLTLTSVCSEIRKINDNCTAGNIAKAAAMGALMGSKGNSGLILAQYFRGFAESIVEKVIINANDIANALINAAKTAREGIQNPREGTILTVANDAAQSAKDEASHTTEIITVLNNFYESSKVSLEKTKQVLQENKEANVVDAGGKGLVLLFEGMINMATGKSVKVKPQIADIKLTKEKTAENIEHQFCTSFIINKNSGITDKNVRDAIKDMGSSMVIDKGMENICKVHIHTNNPDDILEKLSEYGTIQNIVIDDMKKQVVDR